MFSGLGTATLEGANGYTGGTTVSGGTVDVTAAGALGATTGSLTVSGGILDLGGTTQTQNGGATLVSGTIQNGTLSSTGTFGLQSGTVSATLAGTGGLSKTTAGTVILTGTSTYTGGTTIAAGTLQLGNGGTSGLISGNAINDGTLAFDRSDIVTATGVISGTGAVTQIGTGTTTLAGANTYTGQTKVTAGTLGVTGSIGSIATPSGAISIASAGALNVGASGSVTASGLNNAGNAHQQRHAFGADDHQYRHANHDRHDQRKYFVDDLRDNDAAGSINTPTSPTRAGSARRTISAGIGQLNNSGVLNLNGHDLSAASVNSGNGRHDPGRQSFGDDNSGRQEQSAPPSLGRRPLSKLPAAQRRYRPRTHMAVVRQFVRQHLSRRTLRAALIDALGTGPISLNGGTVGATLEFGCDRDPRFRFHTSNNDRHDKPR